MRKILPLSLAGGLLGVSLLGVAPASGQTKDQLLAAEQLVRETPAGQLAGKLKDLMAGAPEGKKVSVASALGHALAATHPNEVAAGIRAIVEQEPQTAAAVVAAAALVLPASAPEVAATAAVSGADPEDVRIAALAAAPGQAAAIERALEHLGKPQARRDRSRNRGGMEGSYGG